MKTLLGKLERIPLRKAWAHEAGEFTPWLAEPDNLNLLAEALGLDELEPVGSHARRILQVRPESPLENEAQWPTYFAWLEEAGLHMTDVFRTRVKALA